MPPEEATPGAPENLTCPACGLKVIVRWSSEERDGQTASILNLGHVKPLCATFEGLEDPEPFINCARAGVIYEANDG